MRNIWNIFRADWRRLTASVVAVVVLLGLCLVPCLYAWFNILSNWDPYGVASTSRIKVAVASADQGYQVMGLELNIGELVLQGLESNDQMGWVFVDDADTALSGVESGEYYAALVVPEEFTGDFVSILTGDLRHPQIQYYENEKKNAIAPKITSKAKTAVQEQINTTVVGKAAEALTTVGTVCKAMGLDSQDLADGIMDKLTSARQETAQIQKVLVSLKDVMDGADSLLAAASVTIRDAQNAIDDAGGAVGGTVQVIGTGMTSANETNSDLLTVLDSADKLLADLDAMLRETGVAGIEETIQANMIARVDEVIVRLTAARDEAEASGDANTAQQLQAVIDGLVDLKEAIGTVSAGGALEPVLDTLAQVRQQLRAAAINTNQQVNDYLQAAGAQAQASLRAIQQLLDAVAGSLGGVSGTLDGYAKAMTTVQPTLDAGITLAGTVEKYLTDIEDDVQRITGSDAFRRFTELMESSDADSMADYLTSPVQMNTEIIYEIKDYGAAMSPYYVMLALFVGSLLTAVMLKVPVTQPEFAGCRAVQRYFGRFITFFLMAMAQALVTAFGCLYFVGMEPAEPALFVLACCLCSLNFACMNYALVYAMDNVGMALSVIIMVIQVAGSGGSYPIHVLPQIFQTLYPFMPFHYGMDMIRETVGGMYGHTYRDCALVLLGMCVLFTVLGLVLYYPARRLNAAIAASKEKSGIM